MSERTWVLAPLDGPSVAQMKAVRATLSAQDAIDVYRAFMSERTQLTQADVEAKLWEALGPRYIWAKDTEPVQRVVKAFLRMIGA